MSFVPRTIVNIMPCDIYKALGQGKGREARPSKRSDIKSVIFPYNILPHASRAYELEFVFCGQAKQHCHYLEAMALEEKRDGVLSSAPQAQLEWTALQQSLHELTEQCSVQKDQIRRLKVLTPLGHLPLPDGSSHSPVVSQVIILMF